MSRRIKAFTLIEIVLTMMLAAILIGMAYTALNLMGKLYSSYHRKALSLADLQLLREMLQGDMKSAEFVSLKAQMITMDRRIVADSGATHLYWMIKKDQLLRSTPAVQDTFRLEGLSVTAWFEGAEVSTGTADRFELRFVQDSMQVRLSIGKQYDSKTLFDEEH